MAISRSNKETFVWLKRIKWKDITQENLVEEADYFFWCSENKEASNCSGKTCGICRKGS